MKLENILLIIIFSLIFIAAMYMFCSCICIPHIDTNMITTNAKIIPSEEDIESNHVPVSDSVNDV